MDHLPYAGYLVCPSCQAKALNLTFVPPIGTTVEVSRRMFRTDTGTISPSKRLLTCQHCGHGFTMGEARVITTPA